MKVTLPLITQHSPLTIQHSLFTIHHSLFIIQHSPFNIQHFHSPFTTHHSPFNTHHSPFNNHHSPFNTHHSLFNIHHSPLTKSPPSWPGLPCLEPTEPYKIVFILNEQVDILVFTCFTKGHKNYSCNPIVLCSNCCSPNLKTNV